MEKVIKAGQFNIDYWRKLVMTNCNADHFVAAQPEGDQSARTEHESIWIEGQLLELLTRASSGQPLGIYCILLSAYYVILHQWHGQTSLMIASGVVSDQATSSEVLNFNTINIDKDETLRLLVERVYERLEFQLSREPVGVNELMNLVATTLHLKDVIPAYGLYYNEVHSGEPMLTADCMLCVHRETRGLRLSVGEYTESKDPNRQRKYLASSILFLLKSFFEDTSQPVHSLSSLADDIKSQLLEYIEGPRLEHQKTQTIITMFEYALRTFPERIAISFQNQSFTYRQLDHLTHLLAVRLIEDHGVKPGSRVGILMSHSAWLPVSVWATLRSGAVFVPMDIRHPAIRLEQIVQDSGISLFLSDSGQYEKLLGFQRPIVAVDIELEIETDRSLLPLPVVSQEDMAYILYTSGTTGKPKGVCVPHASINNYISWSNDYYYTDGSGSHFGWFTPLTFDLSLTGLIGTLCRGEHLVVYDSENPATALEQIFSGQSSVTTLKLTPSHLTLLFGLRCTKSNTLRTVIVGGELLKQLQVDVLRSLATLPVKIYNEYGPTEATVGCSVALIDKLSSITIGRPIANTQLQVVNQHGQMVPPGVTGEIVISGKCLASGYWQRPDENAKRFLTSLSNMRIYMTGDKGYWRSDGLLQYEGRGDQQIKVNGYRVELMEITHTVENLENISGALVLPRKLDGLIKGLVCYYIGTPDVDEVRKGAGLFLPLYMVPDIFIKVDQFPLTANGKVDETQLPAWDSNVKKQYVAPQNEQEQRLQTIFEAVLHEKNISIHDNFFRLGGDSIKAIQIISRIIKEFDVKVEVKDIFDFPTIDGLSKILLANHGQQQYRSDGFIPLFEDQDYYNATQGQMRLWVLNQFSADQIAYHQHSASVITGKLDVPKAMEAFALLTLRHESLRTVFVYVDQRLRQRVLPPDEGYALNYIDVRNVKDIEARIHDMVRVESNRGFDLEKGPLFRGSLFHVYDETFVFIVSTHHIIGDGWSWGILRRELSELYFARLEQRVASLPPVSYQFKDYTGYLQRWKTQPAFEESRSFWCNTLSGEIPVLDLPYSRPRPPVQTFNGRSIEVNVSSEQMIGLRKISRENGVTLFMVLTSILNLLFFKYSGQTDILLGTDAASRTREEFDHTVGFFLDSMVLRTKFDKKDLFNELLLNMKNVILDAFRHQQYPFDNLLEDLGIKRDISRTPFFDVLVIMQVKQNSMITNSGGIKKNEHLSSDVFPLETSSSLVDLEFNFNEYPEGLDITLRYNTDLFEDHLMRQLLTHFEFLINQVVSNPTNPISAYLLLDEASQKAGLSLSRGKRLEVPHLNVLDALSNAVVKWPDHIAIQTENNVITYSMLEELTSRLATGIRSLYSIQPSERVGIYMAASELTVISMLAVLKAGAVFVPIDLTLPKGRVREIVVDAKIKFLISESGVSFADVTVIDIKSMMYQSYSEILKPRPQPIDAAYVLYTSGSTGSPKGVVIPYGALLDYAWGFSDYLKLNATDRIIHQSSISFDTSIEEIFPALVSGASILVIPEARRRDVDFLLKQISIHQPSVLSVTPTYIEELREHGEKLSSLKALISGGEALTSAQYGELWKLNILYNSYGPTEATVCVAFYPVRSDKEDNVLGFPMANHEVFVLSDEGKLQPIGVEGEIYVGGSGLALGYENLPDLTAEQFVAHPFRENERLYKTGDRGRYDEEHRLIFMGRKDDQLKIRGYRIELGEIECRLRKSPLIRQAFVYAVKEGIDNSSLFAYVVASGQIDKGLVHEYIQEYLPAYMIPHLIWVEDIPLTIHGKVDRLSLMKDTVPHSREFRKPVSPTEMALHEIWQSVLAVDVISLDDNFFELGGHSLTATRVCHQINRRFNTDFTLATFFHYPVLGQLAAHLEDKLNKANITITEQSDTLII